VASDKGEGSRASEICFVIEIFADDYDYSYERCVKWQLEL